MKNKRNFRQDMDQALSGLTLGEKKEEILEKAFSSPKKRKGQMARRLAAACLAVCALTAAAFALSPGLRQILAQRLGGWQEESQQFSGLETEDKGIAVRVVSALSDDGFTRIYLEIQDKTGDRLGENISLGTYGGGWDLKLPNQKMGVMGEQCLGYDPESRTALMEVYWGGETSGEEQVAKLSLQEISAQEKFNASLPQTEISSQIQKTILAENTQKAGEKNPVLQPGEEAAPLEGEKGFSLSALGFGDDGAFHVQVKCPEDICLEYLNVLTTLRSRTGQEAQYNQSLIQTLFDWEGELYYDIAFGGVGPEILNDLVLEDLYFYYPKTQPVEGNWELEIDLETPDQLVYTPGTQVEGCPVNRIVLTPMTLSLEIGSDHAIFGQSTVTFVMEDGSKLVLDKEDCVTSFWNGLEKQNGTGHFFGRWLFPKAIQPEKVQSISLGDTVIFSK
ncbi:hypothetical protein DW094_12210 [Ruminococcaceae bacterium AM07-15]|nr:hypothetical protein DW094_12210 [Ruminococcaceae bacterium AM07-15]